MKIIFHPPCLRGKIRSMLRGWNLRKTTEEVRENLSLMAIEQWKKRTPGCSFRVLGHFWSCAPHSKRLFLCILNIVSYGFGSTRGQGPRLSICPTGRNVFVFVRDVTHVQTCEKGLHFSNFWVILETCPNLWWCSCSKCYAIDCFGTFLKHVQTCDDVRVQSATQSTASVHSWNMSKPVITFVFKVLRNRLLQYILETCPNLWWRSCSKCYAIDCFGAYLKHMSKPVMTFVFEVLRNRLLGFRGRRRRKAREEDQMFKIWVLCRVCSATL